MIFRNLFAAAALLGSALLPSAIVAGEVAPPERMALWNKPAPMGNGKEEAAKAFITVHRPVHANGAAMIICPGGGYSVLVTKPEGTGIAQWLNQHGIVGIVLEYRLPQGHPLRPLLDAQRAIRTARANAEKWGLNPNRIGIVGFSAGGHLAATTATHFNAGNGEAADPIEKFGSRPDLAVLIYPVITMGENPRRITGEFAGVESNRRNGGALFQRETSHRPNLAYAKPDEMRVKVGPGQSAFVEFVSAN